jgi:adhesin transport system outer membrane protein
VLALGAAAGADAFRQALAAAVARNPALAEAQAAGDEARAARSEARAALLPTVTLGLSSYRTLSRQFDTDPNYVVERLRAPQRTDATVSLDQPLFDGGASSVASARPAKGCARRRPEWTARRRTLPCARLPPGTMSMPGARWSSSTRAMPQEIGTMREALGERISAAPRRRRMWRGWTALPPPLPRALPDIAANWPMPRRVLPIDRRAAAWHAGSRPLLGNVPLNGTDAREAADDSPAVQGAAAQASGSRKDARAAHADLLPRVSAGMDAGRYGVFENDQNYDVRARVSLNYRFSFGAGARAHQADARASAADARADRVREEAARDAAIARSDLDALDEQIVLAPAISPRAGRATCWPKGFVCRAGICLM